ncbi:amidase [Vreelandella janggokensis]|uniref:amidase n=1 Tax=Vreelandella janggokensis TaxID=370767 RepID=UPI002859CEF5|nr:amidase [Halomonas janggokensis]MDR5886428.1 amidase [Halomonas janggokensis]
MPIPRPTSQALTQSSRRLGMTLDDTTLSEYDTLLQAVWDEYDRLDELTEPLPEVVYPRTSGVFLTADENPYNAWYVKTHIEGKPSGPLANRRVVLKDNVCLAGVPMMNGADSLQGYVPELDATVATRILDAGGRILGKAHCEYFCVSGGSHTNATGPVRNPRMPTHSAGGSSSGCAALLASGEVDMAIGTDQGGSVRIPAAYSGIYGMKATWGLVPYTGIMPIEMTLDHAGIMSATLSDNAILLEAVAGPDGLDPRQQATPRFGGYVEALGQSCVGLRIGVVAEGFEHTNSHPGVDATVRHAADLMANLGAVVETVSIPLHSYGHAIWTPIAVEGTTALLEGYNYGTNWKGLYVPSLMRAQRGWREQSQYFPHDVKTCLLAGDYARQTGSGRYYARARNLARSLRGAYDDMLERFDLLLMPTVPLVAPRLPSHDAEPETWVGRALEMNANTAPFDVTGHPALSLPCGVVDGLPVGMMLIGRDYDEATLYRAGYAFEQSHDWQSLHYGC